MSITDSSGSSLHREVHERFCAAFGTPHHTFAGDTHWRLRPQTRVYAINILLNGDHERPAVWIFDPYDTDDNVVTASVVDLKQVDDLIRMIQQRLDDAASEPRRT